MTRAALNIVCIGGGTGMPQLLAGLKALSRAPVCDGRVDLRRIVAIVSAFDDGGSSGRLMETYDTLPPGDLRNCLLALADEQVEPLMTRFLDHRFTDEDRTDPLAGHSVGNLLLLALAQVYDGDMRMALLNVGRILPIQSRILFPTLSPAVLCAELEDGTVIRGESSIGHRDSPRRIGRIFLEPRSMPRQGAPRHRAAEADSTGPFHAPPMEGVIEALDAADLITMGPGSLYTSVLPHLLVDGVAEALARNQAKVVYVCNIMNEPGETDGFGVPDFVAAIERHGAFRPGRVLVNDQPISEEFYRAYTRERLEVEFERLKVRLGDAFAQAMATLDPAPLRAQRDAVSGEIEALADHIGSSSLHNVQVLPPREPSALPDGCHLVATDLLGSTELRDRGRVKRVIRHDPIKLARALVDLA